MVKVKVDLLVVFDDTYSVLKIRFTAQYLEIFLGKLGMSNLLETVSQLVVEVT